MSDHIVHSLLETDLYKFTMWQALLHSHPGAEGEYEYVCRNVTQIPLASLKEKVEAELDHLCTLRFQPDELEYLGKLRFIKPDFIHYLRMFQFHRDFITVGTDGDNLTIKAKGPIIHVMGFEIFVLCIVSELYVRAVNPDIDNTLDEGRKLLKEKIQILREFADDHLFDRKVQTLAPHPFEFFDFGLRRRATRAWQDEVVATLHREVPEFFKGTSNVYLAKKYGITPIGTMAHEYLQAYQGFGYRLRDFQKMALEGWVQEYRGDLGVALTDVVGSDAFLADFDLYFAKLFDGLRHDSGCPYEWADKVLARYKELKIDANTKRLVFSDGLNLDKAIELWQEYSDKVQLGFGIGTNLTNDIGIKPLNIVMKLMFCNGEPVAKLSDSPGKTLCRDETYLAYLAQVFNVERK